MKKVDNSILSKKRGSFIDPLFTSKYAIYNDTFDVRNFDNLKKEASNINTLEQEGSKTYDKFEELLQDIYSSLFRYHAKLRHEYEMDHKCLVNHMIMKRITSSAKYKELRVVTKLDLISTAIAIEIFAKDALVLLEEFKQKQLKFNKTSEKLANAMAQAATDKDDKHSAIRRTEAEALLKEAYKDLKEWDKNSLESSLNHVFTKTVKDTEDTQNILTEWGLGSGNRDLKLGYRQQMDLVNKIKSSSKLKEIAKLAGRIKTITTKIGREKIKRGSNEIYTIGMGNDLARILPSELSKLSGKNPHRRRLFKTDFIDGKLLQYELSGHAKKSKGPIICCIDESSSMAGGKEYWAKAVALALLDTSQREHRDFLVIHYSGEHSPDQLPTHDFLKSSPPDIVKTIEMAELFLNAGTNFIPPLQLSMSYIDNKPDFIKADIVFITDGEAPLTEKFVDTFNTWTAEKKVQVIAVLIDEGWHSSDTLNQISKMVTKISDINGNRDEGTLFNIFQTLS